MTKVALPQLKAGQLSTIGVIALIMTGMITIAKLQQPKLKSLNHSNLNQIDFAKENQAEKINLNLWKKLPSFGYGNLIADWALLSFIQYYGDDDARDATGYLLSPEYLEIIIKNDPKFISAYLILSPAISINAALPNRTVELLTEGLKHLSPQQPDANYVWLYRGVDQILFLGDVEGAKQSYSMAAKWAKESGNPNLAILAKANEETVKYLTKHPQSKKVRIQAWMLVLSNSNYLKTRQFALKKILELGGRIVVLPNGQMKLTLPKEN